MIVVSNGEIAPNHAFAQSHSILLIESLDPSMSIFKHATPRVMKNRVA